MEAHICILCAQNQRFKLDAHKYIYTKIKVNANGSITFTTFANEKSAPLRSASERSAPVK